jgi:hypothetical protein
MHHIVFPVAFVLGLRFGMDINSESIGFVAFPLTFICVAVGMGEISFSTGFVILPLPFVFGSVRPKLYAVSMSIGAEPFAFVLDAVLEFYKLSFFDCQ